MTNRVQLFEFLYEKCQDDSNLLANILDQFVSTADDSQLNEIEDLLVNNFGED
jgi:hypothetical protein